MVNLNEYLKGLKRRSKIDPVPGTLEKELDEPCPLCGRNMIQLKPCCGSPYGLKQCAPCGYKINIEVQNV